MEIHSSWDGFINSIKNCHKCLIANERHNIVIGEGKKDAKIMFIGEAPGYDEDIMGKPFVGKAGQKLDEILLKVGLKREDIYIANILKCRPPGNRDPKPQECEACMDYLRNQVYLIKPKIIVLLGRVALNNILGSSYRITSSRGKWILKKNMLYMPTWHPSAILRDPSKEDTFIHDLLLVKDKIKELGE